MKRIVLFALLLPLFTAAQLSKKDSIWLPLNFFIGNWVGEGKGESGNGKY